ncbi:TPR repeat-containing protein [Alloactinosynnema sp. L-07]|uniref:hypothetical protein n=1 Tax=Alloactinosynnema sp. L-07 TaxID=1653480 RepID=UPI00065F046C|nr:hypothetical protein [Alloactinosynnema sp. L-07]CRK57697.1 TPR repeat-containing protein [Alloactinosynnema sp. L-07]
MSAANATVTVRLPSGWLDIDPRAEDLTAEVRRGAIAQWGDQVDLSVLDQAAAPMTAELRRLSAVAEVLLAGCYAEAIVGDDNEQPLVLTANVVLAMTPPVSCLAEIRRGLAKRAGAGSTIVGVDLPAGPAVLAAEQVVLSHPEWTVRIPAAQRQYFLQIDGSGKAAVLSFLTPNLDLADEFDAVFRAIADTLTVTPLDHSGNGT